MPISEEATRNGSTPMSTRRVTAPAASLVWTVENTRCPVSEAWMAISAVSRSRISPTMITSGSWRRKLRSPFANVRSIFGFTGVWEMPCSWYSTGSSMVMMFRSGRLILLNAVHAEADADVLLLRLDVDVARAFLGGAEEQGVDETDDGSLVARIEQVLRLLELVRHGVEIACLQIADQLLGLVRGPIVDG